MSRFPSVKEKFEKAVNVIRNLPKNGTFQPSHDLQLTFYGYYKQATEGPNHHSRPSFYQVVKKAKWDAWAKLGNMTREEAMTHYVEELRKIVETMSYTDNVASFLNSLDNFYEHVPPEDLEMLIGPVIERIRSRPNSPLSGSPLASRDTSPSRSTRSTAISREEPSRRLNSNNVPAQKHITSSLETSPASSYSVSPLPPDTDEEEEEEHFLDTQMEPDRTNILPQKTHVETANTMLHQNQVVEPLAAFPPAQPLGERNSLNLNATLSPEDCLKLSDANMDYKFRHEINNITDTLFSLERYVTDQSSKPTQHWKCSNLDQTTATSSGMSSEFLETVKTTLEKMARDMENIQQHMISVEKRRQQEMSLIRKKNKTIRSGWGLSSQTTIVLLAWPILLLLISKWLSNRRRR